MAIHPIAILDEVLDDYKGYLRSEFRARDPELKATLDRELDRPLFLAQEPFYQAHRPFREGRPWSELPLDPQLARVMHERSGGRPSYVHQSGAITELLSPQPRPVVVTTGTGSGKTESFLLPVLQNALLDAAAFEQSGLTSILVYPMNALANDQLLRINDYLQGAGLQDRITVGQYDRSTPQSQREAWRRNPPRILLTNYMMLEYLLVRPADREEIFANHRCRFLVLDEVHSYRGALGSNIALLVRRLRGHLARARQDWRADVPADQQRLRFPALVPVGTSATIKSVSEEEHGPARARELRNAAVQDFFSRLTGVPGDSIQVFGEELRDIDVPAEARYAPAPAALQPLDVRDAGALLHAARALSGADSADLAHAARQARILWDLNRWLSRQPLSVAQMVERVLAEVPERRGADRPAVEAEVQAALALGAALPDGTDGALRLRGHRFIRGGWRFHRCVSPACGRLYPMGEERCSCGTVTAPLYLCRNCGAHYLRFAGDPDTGTLRPSASEQDDAEWMLYEHRRFDTLLADEELENGDGDGQPLQVAVRRRVPTQIRGRPLLQGSFDPGTLMFSRQAADYPLQVMLSPARTQCLCCGGSAGSRNVITSITLGTSAALKVMSEALIESLDAAKRHLQLADDKERLLVFSDSRQDAAHQARFIAFASRYDRMRRHVYRLLAEHGPLTLRRTVELLGDVGVRQCDNPFAPGDQGAWVSDERLHDIRAWEEAPLLDDLAVTAGYRGTLLNLGMVGVDYHRLDEYVDQRGDTLARQLGLEKPDLAYLLRCLLDEMRVRGALSRDMLRYHTAHPRCPDEFKRADWERRVKQPKGYACTADGSPLTNLDGSEVPSGIALQNVWRRHGAGGRGPSFERIVKHLLQRFGAGIPDEQSAVLIMNFLRPAFVVPVDLFGARQSRKLLQVNADVVRLVPLTDETRLRCLVCGSPRPLARVGAPCPSCSGTLVRWPDAAVREHRAVRRLLQPSLVHLEAREHTAQVPTAVRQDIEEKFKAPSAVSPINLLACSPTLEMGIDVGGLDAVALRNVPPRPDNYAQRGGRAGRRSRVGLVLGYARGVPHDQYFYDHPAEMIAGEVAAPALALGNRDVLLRHVAAIVFGEAEPGLSSRMADYVSPTGEIVQDRVQELVASLSARFEPAVDQAVSAFGQDVLADAGLTRETLREALDQLPARVMDVFERTARQVRQLRQALDAYAAELVGRQAGTRSGDLVARLLGLPTEGRGGRTDQADDRSAGYPLRRFAEFGILPGYEFPSSPATLRLLGDPNEDDPVAVARRFGLAQFQPDAPAYARGKRWRSIGLDTASPWNPRSDGPTWTYRKCAACSLRFAGDSPVCPRCGDGQPGRVLPAFEFGGFLARRDEAPVIDEEERFQIRNMVKGFPQWDGQVVGRWRLAGGWTLRLSREETVQWVNEGPPPSGNALAPLHNEARGFTLCSACGRNLTPQTAPPATAARARPATRAAGDANPFGHAANCPHLAQPPVAIALHTGDKAEVLRLLVPIPVGVDDGEITDWCLTLGYSLRAGLRHLFMLDGSEIEFVMEGPWEQQQGADVLRQVAISFIDPSIGGTGYLRRAGEQFHLVARHALQHLDHQGCETACYRCLKSYANQRHHQHLRWPLAVPDLEAIAAEAPGAVGLTPADTDDPRPWLEAFAAGVGSPLELRFLRMFERHGIEVQRQVPVAARDGERPISLADFASVANRVAIYVDGASFHRGVALRRDRRIRDALRGGTPPWTVVELRVADLGREAEVIAALQGLLRHQG